MTKAEEMAMKTVHDLGVAGDWDVCNYPEGKEAAQGIPDINEPMCIPITNITFGRRSDNEAD